MNSLDDRIDARADRLFAEIATRESYYLFEKVLDELDTWAYESMLKATDDDSRLVAQARGQTVQEIRKKIKKHKSQLTKEVPITIGP